MAGAHPLHDLLAGLADGTVDPHGGDLVATLREGGHPDLPDGAVAEAIVSYADTAALEVAEHLAPFVMGHSAVPLDPPPGTAMEVRDGLELVATAPPAEPLADPLDEPVLADGGAALDPTTLDPTTDRDPGDLDFGTGAAGDTGGGTGLGLPEPAAEPAGPEPLEPVALPELDLAGAAGLDDLFPAGPTDGDSEYGDSEYGDLDGGSFGGG